MKDRFTRRDLIKLAGLGLVALAFNSPKTPGYPEEPVEFIDWQETTGDALPKKFLEAYDPNQVYVHKKVEGYGTGTTPYTLDVAAQIDRNETDNITLKIFCPMMDALTLFYDRIDGGPYFINSSGRTIGTQMDTRYLMGAANFAGKGKIVEMLFKFKAFFPFYDPALGETIDPRFLDKRATVLLFPAQVGRSGIVLPDRFPSLPKNVLTLKDLETPIPEGYYMRVTQGKTERYYTGMFEKERDLSNT